MSTFHFWFKSRQKLKKTAFNQNNKYINIYSIYIKFKKAIKVNKVNYFVQKIINLFNVSYISKKILNE